MSIIVALISKQDGAVASDGRLFGSARISNGTLTSPATIESDTFDKTFTLVGGKIIGALSGLMSFSGNTVSNHISEIVTPLIYNECDFYSLAGKLELDLKKRLTQIDDQEVIFHCRKLDVLLVGSADLTRSNMCIISIRIFPQQNIIMSERERVEAGDQKRFYVRGEDKAVSAAVRLFAKDKAPNKDPAFLKRLATNAIRIGIRAAGNHPYGTAPACGGSIFTKHTWYI
jgi:hypothetical protein